jgi:hypothetical protein
MAARRGRGPEHGDRGNQVNTRGHNENAVRLAALAGDAQVALDKVARGEADAIEGWLAYGAALNEGRALFPGDREFGQWVEANVLGQLAQGRVEPKEQQAAMWAAGHRDQFEEARAAGDARTVRGIHAKWKEIEAAREKVAREAEAKARAEAEAQVRRDAADKAAKQAEARAADEAAARQAAKDAETDAEREAAKVKLADAINARKEAEKKAEEAKAEPVVVVPEPEPEPEDPATAKLRRDLAKLTHAALVDDLLAERAGHARTKDKLRAARDQNATLKAQVSALTDASDMGRKLGMAIRERDTAKGRMAEYQTIAVKAERQVRMLTKERDDLRAQVEGQEIALG